MDRIKEYLDIEDQKMDSETKTTNKQGSKERPYNKTYCTLNNVITCDYYEAKSEDNLKTFTQGSKENYSDYELQKDEEHSMIDNMLEAKNKDNDLTEFTHNFEEKRSDYKPYNVNTYEAKNEGKNLNDFTQDCEGKDSDYELSKDEQNAMMVDIIMDPTMENGATPKIDPEEEREKYNQMVKNSISMRGRVLLMEIELSISNKADNILENFNVSLIDHFDDVIKEIRENLSLARNCFDNNSLDSANEYITKAEEMFIQLRPEKRNKKSNDDQDSSKANDSILKHVKPKNYQPGSRDKVTVVGNIEDVRKCLHVAGKAMTDRNHEKAKRFLQKSQRIFHTPAAEKLLEQIRIIEETQLSLITKEKSVEEEENVAGTSKETDKNQSTKVTSRQPLKRSHSAVHNSPEARKRRANNCLMQAKEAYNSDDKNAAMKLAKKAQLVNPTPEAKEFLAEILKDIDAEGKKKSFEDSVKDKETCKSRTKALLNEIQHEKSKAQPQKLEIIIMDGKKTVKSYSRKDRDTINKKSDVTEITSDSSDEELEKSENNKKKTTDNQNITEVIEQNVQMETQKPGMVRRFIGFAKSIFIDKEEVETSEINYDEQKINTDEASTSKTEKTSYSHDDKQKQNVVLKYKFSKVYNAQVEKFINSAMDAISKKNYGQAENILKRSQKLYKTEMADELMQQVKEAIKRISIEADLIEDEEIQAEIKADELIYAATAAIMENDYDFAAMLLQIAVIKYDAEFAEELLPVVQNEARLPIYYKRRTASMLKTAAERYVEIAHDMISKKLLENGEDILIIAQNTHPTDEAKQLMTAIRNKLYSRNANNLGKASFYEWVAHKKAKQGYTTSSEVYKSNCYTEMAQRAFISGNHDVAEALLIEADQLNPSIEIKHLRRQVENSRYFMENRNKERQQRIWR